MQVTAAIARQNPAELKLALHLRFDGEMFRFTAH